MQTHKSLLWKYKATSPPNVSISYFAYAKYVELTNDVFEHSFNDVGCSSDLTALLRSPKIFDRN